MLDTFIKKFVLCEQCDNPETHFKILEKKGTIKSSCAACGHSFMIDMRHKLTTYIIKVRYIALALALVVFCSSTFEFLEICLIRRSSILRTLPVKS